MAAGDDDAVARRARAEARRARVMRVFDDDSEELTPDQRMELVETLTRAAWAMSGQPWPSLPRDQWPVRVCRLGDQA